MDEENIIDFLFEKKAEDGTFSLDDEILNNLDNKIDKCTNEITNFINKRIHPKSRFKLKKMLARKENRLYDYSLREKKLLYKDGVIDGMNLILCALSLK